MSFHIERGELVGYIGSDGAGKSTTLTTHDPADVEKLCGWVLMIGHRRLTMTGTWNPCAVALATAAYCAWSWPRTTRR